MVDEWCKDKSRWWRAVILIVLLREWFNFMSDPLQFGWFNPINLGIHELGHVLFRPFGDWLMVAGGSITETAVPLIAAFMFLRQPDFFAIAVCGGWLSSALYQMATYMADATTLELDVV